MIFYYLSRNKKDSQDKCISTLSFENRRIVIYSLKIHQPLKQRSFFENLFADINKYYVIVCVCFMVRASFYRVKTKQKEKNTEIIAITWKPPIIRELAQWQRW